MRKGHICTNLVSFVAWIAFVIVASFPLFGAPEQERQVITMTATPGRVIQDWEGTALLFQDDPTPIRFFLDARLQPGDERFDWHRILSAYRVSVMLDNKFMNPEDILLAKEVRIIHYPLWVYCVVEVTPRAGRWSPGYYIVGGGFDRSWLLRNDLPDVNLCGDLKEIRVVCRPKQSGDDELLRMRFAVLRWATVEQLLPGDPRRALQAIEQLLKAFPGDCYAHAYAGKILEDQRRYEEAIPHYEQLCKAIAACYPQAPPYWLVIQWPNTVAPNEKFRALRFDYWLGKRGPQEIHGYLRHEMRAMRAFLPFLKSPYLLKLNDVKDPTALALRLKDEQEPLSRHLRYGVGINILEWLHDYDGKGAPPQDVLEALVANLNHHLWGPCLYDKERFANVKLRGATKELLEKWPPKQPDPEAQLRLNRMLLEDAWPTIVQAR